MNEPANKPNEYQPEDREQRKAMGRWVKPRLYSFQRGDVIASATFFEDTESDQYNPTSGPFANFAGNE